MIKKISEKGEFNGISNDVCSEVDKIIEEYNTIVELLANSKKGYNVRYQDYYDVSVSSKENLKYFTENFLNVNDDILLQYCKYILDKLLDDLFFTINNPEYGIEELYEIMEENNTFNDVRYLYVYMNNILATKEKDVDLSNDTNLLITFDNVDEIIDILTKNQTGSSEISLNKAKGAFNTLRKTRYNDPEMLRKVHKVVDNDRGHDLKITDHNIFIERYSTSGSTKVLFLKMPVDDSNKEIIKNILGNKNFENIYFVTGFGDFSYSGYDEYDFYRIFIKIAYDRIDEIQKFVDLISKPLIYDLDGKKIDKTHELIEKLGQMSELIDGNFNIKPKVIS